MIDFESKFTELEEVVLGTQKKISDTLPLSTYYGINTNGDFRLAFLSETKPQTLKSTKVLKVFQGIEDDKYYWTCIDLVDRNAKHVFYVLCDDLIQSIKQTDSEEDAINIITERYLNWSKMFSKDISKLSEEKIKGLIGELYFLKNYLAKKIGLENAIRAWSGAIGTSKDFSVNEDWYEVKAVSIGSATVKISSLYQLESDLEGTLAIVELEKMSESYTDGQSCIKELFYSILSQIKDSDIKEEFINKIIAYGFDYADDNILIKYAIKSLNLYKVDKKFPKIKSEDIPIKDIFKISYELIIKNLDEYKVEGL